MREAQVTQTSREPTRHSLTSLILSRALDHLGSSRKHRDEGHAPIPYMPRRHPPGYVPLVSRSISYQAPLPPCPRLPRRKRCLTPTSFESTSSNSSSSPSPWVDDQSQSLLLRLPRELRLLIYEQAIGDRLVHVIRRRCDGHQCILCHTACKSDGEPNACREAQCRGFKLPTGLFVKSAVSGHGYGGIIQLLQTCRKVYIDAVQALYASNTFSFDSMETLVEFSTCILPHRLDSIQSLQLDFRFDQSLQFSESTASNDWPRWERIWRIIDSMKSLQNLKVRISWPKQTSRFDATQEKRLLEPLFMVRGLRRYEVNLQRLKGGEEWSVERCPFRVVRRI